MFFFFLFLKTQNAWDYVSEKYCIMEIFLYLIFQLWKKFHLVACPNNYVCRKQNGLSKMSTT